MFKYIKSTTIPASDILDIDVFIDKAVYCVVNSATNTILNYSDSAFKDFETNIYEFITSEGFELIEEQHKPDNSHYYIYEYSQDNKKLMLRVRLRLSDHYADDREIHGISYNSKELSEHNLHKETKQAAKAKYGNRAHYASDVVNIVFNNENYTDYEEARVAIETQILKFVTARLK